MQAIVKLDALNTKAKLAAMIHSIMYGLPTMKVYPYKAVVNKSKNISIFDLSFI